MLSYPMRGQGAPLIVARTQIPKYQTRLYRSIYIASYHD
jgi:hypothetical protein